jgi:hypothetical protein
MEHALKQEKEFNRILFHCILKSLNGGWRIQEKKSSDSINNAFLKLLRLFFNNKE